LPSYRYTKARLNGVDEASPAPMEGFGREPEG